MGHRGYGYGGTATAPAVTNPQDVIRDANFVPFPNKFMFKNVRQYDRIRESLDALPSVEVGIICCLIFVVQYMNFDMFCQ